MNVSEQIGEMVETLENLTAALGLPFGADTHVKALQSALPQLSAKAKAIYTELTGENPWHD